ncbi:uncharacterized protein LOC143032333 [Oratosquilla oratoria]|uniref:uncharacterized protein LOC143032333 n=1 Tax=Oratosquilla oratoria TaxID=337810 RepID=UPI003F774602
MWRGTFQVACNPNRWGVKGALISKTKWMTLHTFSYFVYPHVQYVIKTFKGGDMGLCTTLFEKESYILDLVNHENIIKCMEVRHTLNTAALVFPKPHWTLEMYIKKKRSSGISEQQLVCWGHAMLKGLDYLHTQVEVIHRNIHPSNVFLMSKDHVCLAGFEYAQRNVDNHCLVWVGTIGYRAPEMILQRVKHTNAVDIFSTGATFFFMVHGFSPFDSIKTVHDMAKINVHMMLDEKLSRNCRHLLIDMMAYPSVQRPSTTMCLSHDIFKKTACDVGDLSHQWHKDFDNEKDSRIIGQASGSGTLVIQDGKESIAVKNKPTENLRKCIYPVQDITDFQLKNSVNEGITHSHQEMKEEHKVEKKTSKEGKHVQDRVGMEDMPEKFEYSTEMKKEKKVKRKEMEMKCQLKMSDDLEHGNIYEEIPIHCYKTVKTEVKVEDSYAKTELVGDIKGKESSSKEDENKSKKDDCKIVYCEKDDD